MGKWHDNEIPHPCLALRNLYIEAILYLGIWYVCEILHSYICLVWGGVGGEWGKWQLLSSFCFWQTTVYGNSN